MLLSAVSVLVVAQSSSEIPEGLMNNPVCIYNTSFAQVPPTYAVVSVPEGPAQDGIEYIRCQQLYVYARLSS